MSGQYSQSKLSVSRPVFSPPLILSRGRQDLVEARRRLVEAGLLEARLVPEQQRLGDVVGHHVVLALEHPVREIVRLVARLDGGLGAEPRRQVEQRALRGIFEAERALDVDDVGRRAGGELRLVVGRQLGPLLVDPFDLDAGPRRGEALRSSL